MNQKDKQPIEDEINAGITEYEKLSGQAKLHLLALILKESEEPLNFITETRFYKIFPELIYDFFKYKNSISSSNILTAIAVEAEKYNRNKIIKLFEKIKKEM